MYRLLESRGLKGGVGRDQMFDRFARGQHLEGLDGASTLDMGDVERKQEKNLVLPPLRRGSGSNHSPQVDCCANIDHQPTHSTSVHRMPFQAAVDKDL